MAMPKTPALTTDCVIYDSQARVLLVRRGHEPFAGSYALPGGFIDIGETAEAACRREVHEETGIEVAELRLVGIYSDPNRDPRGHTASVAYMSSLAAAPPLRPGSDAAGAKWISDWRSLPLAFDHAQILADAERLLASGSSETGRLAAKTTTARAKPSPERGAEGGNAGKVGVLLVNLGTPDATDYWSVRRYLREFLSDPRVIETNRALWWLILNFIVLTVRPSRSGEKYRTIWNDELNESPLRTITRAQGGKVAAALAARSNLVVVDWAMRYGTPSIAARIAALRAQGCERLLIFPLYPQYSASTTASVNDEAFDAVKAMRDQPAVRTVPPYASDPVYVAALADSIRAHLEALAFDPEVILASYHGLPKSYVEKGDPYMRQCALTSERLREALGPLGDKLKLTFQSRFGRAEWLQPYTDKTVEALARQGVKRLAIVTPGFAADCIETLEEIAVENKEIFIKHGGEQFSFIPCLNDSDAGIRVLLHIIERELQGWL
jgi:protoporphyrin/coproporphyrin ferrochelatase